MAPKEKKKSQKESDIVPMNDEELNIDLDNQRLVLEKELLALQEEASILHAQEQEMLKKVKMLEKDLESDKEATFSINANLARHFKSKQEELINKINSLETILTEQREELDLADHELKEMLSEKKQQISVREKTIVELKDKMDNMAKEFAEMLTRTLDVLRTTVHEKIFDVEKNQKAEQVNEILMKKFESADKTIKNLL